VAGDHPGELFFVLVTGLREQPEHDHAGTEEDEDAENGGDHSASSTNRQSAFASRISGIELQFTSSSFGLATRYASERAREIATLRRFRESRNCSPRGTFSPLELAIE